MFIGGPGEELSVGDIAFPRPLRRTSPVTVPILILEVLRSKSYSVLLNWRSLVPVSIRMSLPAGMTDGSRRSAEVSLHSRLSSPSLIANSIKNHCRADSLVDASILPMALT